MDESQRLLGSRPRLRGRLLVTFTLAIATAVVVLALVWYRNQAEAAILYQCYGTTQWEICTSPPP